MGRCPGQQLCKCRRGSHPIGRGAHPRWSAHHHRCLDVHRVARAANQRGDNYVLATVLFASVLFFAGISSKFDRNRERTALLVMGAVLLLVGIGVLATFPVEV